MFEEKGTLPFGVEYEGKICRDYALREQLVRDAVEVLEGPDSDRAAKSDSFYSVCIMAHRLSIFGVPKGEINTELLMGMTQEDYNELSAADKRIKEKRRSFRDAAQAAKEAPDRVAQAGV